MKNYVNKTEVCGSRPQWPTFVSTERRNDMPKQGLSKLKSQPLLSNSP